jgi:hypothetical protein
MKAQRHSTTAVGEEKARKSERIFGGNFVNSTHVIQSKRTRGEAFAAVLSVVDDRLGAEEVQTGLVDLNDAQELSRLLLSKGSKGVRLAMHLPGAGPHKQEWVLAFADALMAASKSPIDHIKALQLGYHYWELQCHRDPIEVSQEELRGLRLDRAA